MGLTETLLLAIGNAFVPGLGLFASIVSAITSDDRNSGKRFLFDLATNVLPSNFFVDLASGVVSDTVFEYSPYAAAQIITPENPIVAPCGICGSFSKRYVLRKGTITCSRCLSVEIENRTLKDYKIYVYEKKTSVLHGRFIESNKIYSRQITSSSIRGRRI